MKNKILTKALTSLFALSLLAGCGTVFTGKEANVSLNTSDGKQVKIEVQSATGTKNVTAPTSIVVPKNKAPLLIKVKDRCYEETSQSIPSKLNLVSLANFLFGTFGTTSAFVDLDNGAFWTYENSTNIPVTRKAVCK